MLRDAATSVRHGLLVHAAGGVGLLVCVGATLGATVIGTVSSEDKARVARSTAAPIRS